MIENYEIKNIDGEDILILYLSFDYEFSTFENNSVLNRINNFIKSNKLKWQGNKVILVVGGVVLGAVALGRINIAPYNHNDNFHYVSEIVLNHYDTNNNNIGYSKIVPKEPLVLKDEKKVNNYVITNNNQVMAINEEDIYQNTQIEKDIKINLLRHKTSLISLPLERYIIGVVGATMNPNFELEALKAQAIASRTYALKYLQNNKYLTDDKTTQIYKDNIELMDMWKEDFISYYNKIKKAVSDTNGIVITYDNKLIQALYYATSNGYTESSYEVFGYTYPYLTVINSIWDLNVDNYLKEQYFSYEDLENLLKIPVTSDSVMEIVDRNLSSRITSFRIDDHYFSGVEFRNLLNLRSCDFTIEKVADGIIITTKGYGHGVGMSQNGANIMARKGKTYQQILAHYYPNTTLKMVNKDKLLTT